ncbi:neprilysin-2-like isoform X2 [Aphidius gifuensis]|nr:neprilysin-2-like isoform X2 [Aphidius gifuensis]
MKPTTYRLQLFYMRNILKEKLNEDSVYEDKRPIQLAKQFWQNCKITSQDEAITATHLLLKRLGGWPTITDSWNSSHFTWVKFSKCSRRLGFLPSVFIHIGLNVDEIHKPWSPNDTIKLTIERPIFANNSKEQKALYIKIAKLLSHSKSPKINEINDALNFRKKIHQLKCLDDEKMNEITIEELLQLYPNVDWIDYLETIVNHRQSNYLSSQYRLLVNTCYLTALEKLIKSTDKRVQANYAFLGIIDDLFRIIRPQLALAFASSTSEVQDICFDATSAIFGSALDMLTAQLVDEGTLRILNELENNIIEETYEMVHHIPWIDHQTQMYTDMNRRKLSIVNLYLVEIFNDDYFDRLDLTQPTAILVLFREVNTFLLDKYYLQLENSRTRYTLQNDIAYFSLPFSPGEISVRSDLTTNKIYVPAGSILTGKLLIIPELDFLNYGVLGLEIAAGLADHIYQKGSYTNENGSEITDTSWSRSADQQFMKQQSCHMISSNMKIKKNYEQLFRTLWATEISYKAAFEFCASHLCLTTLPGLNYSARQLFWLNAVASDCDENLKLRYNTMVSQNKHFSKDFNCPLGSKMNPTDKCRIFYK